MKKFSFLNSKKFWIIAVIVLILLPWLLSLLKCETLTLLHGKEFEGKELQTNMLGESDYLKVLSYSDTEAEVYYVDRDGTGDTLNFEKQDGEWVYTNWNTIWSACGGSAEGAIWPYWWHWFTYAHKML